MHFVAMPIFATMDDLRRFENHNHVAVVHVWRDDEGIRALAVAGDPESVS